MYLVELRLQSASSQLACISALNLSARIYGKLGSKASTVGFARISPVPITAQLHGEGEGDSSRYAAVRMDKPFTDGPVDDAEVEILCRLSLNLEPSHSAATMNSILAGTQQDQHGRDDWTPMRLLILFMAHLLHGRPSFNLWVVTKTEDVAIQHLQVLHFLERAPVAQTHRRWHFCPNGDIDRQRSDLDSLVHKLRISVRFGLPAPPQHTQPPPALLRFVPPKYLGQKGPASHIRIRSRAITPRRIDQSLSSPRDLASSSRLLAASSSPRGPAPSPRLLVPPHALQGLAISPRQLALSHLQASPGSHQRQPGPPPTSPGRGVSPAQWPQQQHQHLLHASHALQQQQQQQAGAALPGQQPQHHQHEGVHSELMMRLRRVGL